MVIRFFWSSIVGVLLLAAFAFHAPAYSQTVPTFCERVSPGLLTNLHPPYARKTASDGTNYCEGLLVKPIGVPPPAIISVKQAQTGIPPLGKNPTLSLSWCAKATAPVHVRLRSIGVPHYGLDAVDTGSFTWDSRVIGRLQPNWANLAATGIRRVPVSGRNVDAIVPLRIGSGYTGDYVFVIRSSRAIRYNKVLLEPVGPSQPVLLDISLAKGPSPDTWLATVAFRALGPGLYRVTFQDQADPTGAIAAPVHVLHRRCPANG